MMSCCAPLVRESVRVCPQQVASRKVGFGDVRIERQGRLGGGECLLFQLAAFVGLHVGETCDVGRREFGVGAQILKDLGIVSIRLLASSQRTYVGLGGFGIEIAETETLES